MTRRLGATLFAAALVSACGNGAGPGAQTQVTLHLAQGNGTSAPIRAALMGDTLTDGSNELVLDTVQLVLRDVRLKRVEDDACPDDEDSLVAVRHDDGEDSHDDHADACEFSNAGPLLLDVPLGSGVERVFAVAVDTGTFDQLRIKVHKPEDNGDAKDAQFLAAHPEFQGVSIRVVGTFNGTPFEFTSDLDAEQRMDLVPPLAVADSVQNVDVTLTVDLSGWFSDGAGGLVDPSTAGHGGANEDVVRDNIEHSFHAFRDDDRDGHDGPGDD